MSRKGTAGFRSPNHALGPKAIKTQQSDRPDTPKPGPTLSVVDRSVLRSGLSYDSFVRLLIQSALSRLTIWSQADLDRLLMLSERLGLDPLNNEIYASEVTPEKGKKARIVFVVGVDGWSKIINSHPQFDGMKFVESAPGDDELPLYFECTMFRKDRRWLLPFGSTCTRPTRGMEPGSRTQGGCCATRRWFSVQGRALDWGACTSQTRPSG